MTLLLRPAAMSAPVQGRRPPSTLFLALESRLIHFFLERRRGRHLATPATVSAPLRFRCPPWCAASLLAVLAPPVLPGGAGAGDVGRAGVARRSQVLAGQALQGRVGGPGHG